MTQVVVAKKAKNPVSKEGSNDDELTSKKTKIIEKVVITEKDIEERIEKQIVAQIEEEVAKADIVGPSENIANPPTSTVAQVQEAESENPTEQIFGVIRDIRASNVDEETINANASTTRVEPTILDVEYAMGA